MGNSYFSAIMNGPDMNVKRCITLMMLMLLSSMGLIQGQWESTPRWQDRLFFGGNFGLQFGSITRVEVSPLVGYAITPRFSSGVGIRYEYYRENIPGVLTYDTHIYGGSVFSRYMVIRDLNNVIPLGLNAGVFSHLEYELLSLESYYFENPLFTLDGRFKLHSVLLGGGVYLPIGPRAAFLVSVLWNLNETVNTIYSNPVIRVGFNF